MKIRGLVSVRLLFGRGFSPSTRGTFFAALQDELRGYELRKGTVQFSLKAVPMEAHQPHPAKLLAAWIVATRKKPLLAERKRKRA